MLRRGSVQHGDSVKRRYVHGYSTLPIHFLAKPKFVLAYLHGNMQERILFMRNQAAVLKEQFVTLNEIRGSSLEANFAVEEC